LITGSGVGDPSTFGPRQNCSRSVRPEQVSNLPQDRHIESKYRSKDSEACRHKGWHAAQQPFRNGLAYWTVFTIAPGRSGGATSVANLLLCATYADLGMNKKHRAGLLGRANFRAMCPKPLGKLQFPNAVVNSRAKGRSVSSQQPVSMVRLILGQRQRALAPKTTELDRIFPDKPYGGRSCRFRSGDAHAVCLENAQPHGIPRIYEFRIGENNVACEPRILIVVDRSRHLVRIPTRTGQES